MATLEAEPTGWASWSADVMAGSEKVTRLEITLWRTRGRFELEGEPFSVEPSGFFLLNATLQRRETLIARAEKTSFWRRSFLITSAGHRMTLESRSWRGREYALILGGREVGTVTRQGLSGRKVRLDFPDEVPPALQIFLLYLVLAQARREAAAASGG